MAESADPRPSHALSPSEFAAKWQGSTRNERAASQEHFIDLCRMLGVQTPNEADPTGEWYAFERGAEKTGGGGGFADVWKRGHFGWEYKGKRKNLDAAYDQLLQYREALENPPSLVVSDLDRFEVHTNFTNTATEVHRFSLTDLRDAPAEPLRILRAVMTDPEALRPATTPAQITEQAATQFALLAGRLQDRGHDPERVAHFLNRVLFCLFAEDVGLLPPDVMTRLIGETLREPQRFEEGLRALFALMSEGGGMYGVERIEWFNGGLFDDDDVIALTGDELTIVQDASVLDWSQVEPSILGTLFERGLDPEKRGQLGAHYTDREKIMMVVEPVVMTPLRREFDAMQEQVEALLEGRTPAPFTLDGRPRARRPKWERDAEALFHAFLARLENVRVLDPACGSGNFLYVTLRLVKDLEKEAAQWGALRLRVTSPFPAVGPRIVLGLELNPYAAELARVSIWVGHIQWMIDNGYSYRRDPILQPLGNIERRDAILVHEEGQPPRPAEWPEAEFIVGNPPFLGGKRLRTSLGDGYVDAMFEAWDGRVPREADLVCYWHEQARAQVEAGRALRAGLLATNSIRGGANRRVLQRVKESGDIFMAWSDEPWIVEGAAVRVSIVGQDGGAEAERSLDGEPVEAIHADLTGGALATVDLTGAVLLAENSDAAFQGPVKVGPFEISAEQAKEMLVQPSPHGRGNSEVIRPWLNGLDVTRRPRGMWIVEFAASLSEGDAALYEAPFEYVRRNVKPLRVKNRDRQRRDNWWRLGRSGADLKQAVSALSRFIVTPRVAKHRLFIWVPSRTLPDSATIAIARDDDYAFGMLHSRVHELWSLRMGTWLGKGNDPRYTPTTTFETFPFPWPLNTPDDDLTPEQASHRDTIGAAARALNEARERWLNPPELVRSEPDVVDSFPPRLLPVDAAAERELKERTLTNLYNARPTWLDNLHRDLDRVVLAAYGWPEDIEEDDLLSRLLERNLVRAGES